MQFGSSIPVRMPPRLPAALVAALLLLRLPSLVQPMGADQGLYAYVGERNLHGELAYRDAWDQKPPGIHYVYALLRAVSARDVVVTAALALGLASRGAVPKPLRSARGAKGALLLVAAGLLIGAAFALKYNAGI